MNFIRSDESQSGFLFILPIVNCIQIVYNGGTNAHVRAKEDIDSMLEIRNITKTYRSKKGESVRALDNISIQFPESGMVFLLGKSGSGKSTLLNVIGGLDSYDSGEFVIMGKSSADFVGSDFDAYRNTFIGFIFQEYNVLDEFTVGANIGLALELQGKKATNEAVNAILEKVDLVGYAGRKPNELSGGQKQRVAIARALVKDPQIIMADEPTGALDSATGKQIFDALKELSREKLVLVVSHDREFAERYADRIIELSDGRIIDDVIKEGGESTAEHVGVHRVSDTVLRINSGYVLTQKDLEMINAYLANAKEDVILSADRRVNAEFAAKTDIGAQRGSGGFRKTDPEKIKAKKYDKEKTHFIRSRLPMKNAVRMGASGLRHKKFRLVMTILLSFISFAMFGLADTMAAYQQISSATDSVIDSNVRNASITLGVRYTYQYGDQEPSSYYNSQAMNDDDIAWLRSETGLAFSPVYNGSTWSGIGSGMRMSDFMPEYEGHTNMDAFTATMAGFVAMDDAALAETGFKVTGRRPQTSGEVMITEFMYRQFHEYGFENSRITPTEKVKAGSVTMSADGSAESIIGKHLSFDTGRWTGDRSQCVDLEIVGVIDTAFDYDRYERFLPTDEPGGNTEGEEILNYVLGTELEHELSFGFHTLGFMTKEGLDFFKMNATNKTYGTFMDLMDGYVTLKIMNGDYMLGSYSSVANSSVIKDLGKVTWRDGRTNGVLGENEILVSDSLLKSMTQNALEVTLTDARMNALIELCGGEEIWRLTEPDAEKCPHNLLERYYSSYAVSYILEMLENEPAVLARVQDDMAAEGFTGSAADFWIRKWLIEDNGTYPGAVFDEEKLHHVTVMTSWSFNDQEYLRALKPWLEELWNIELREDITSYELGNFAAFLNSFYENERTVKVSADELRWTLMDYYTRYEVDRNELWKNQKMVDLLIANGQYASSPTDWTALGEQQREMMINFYRNFYTNDWEYGEHYASAHDPIYTNDEYTTLAGDTLLHMSGLSQEQILNDLTLQLQFYSHEKGEESEIDGYSFTLAGFFEGGDRTTDLVVSDTLHTYYTERRAEEDKMMMGDTEYREEIADHEEGEWAFAIAPMPKDREVITKLMEMHYAEEGPELDLKFKLNNAVMSTLDSFNSMIEVLAKVFLWVGLGFAVFSAFLLMNFIATSISYKKREIGILRAVGARSSDVFKIFFSESFIIAIINFVLAVVGSLTTVIILNNYMRTQGINITLLRFGVRQVALMLGVSILVAIIASFLPVWNIAKRKPVDAIKDR